MKVTSLIPGRKYSFTATFTAIRASSGFDNAVVEFQGACDPSERNLLAPGVIEAATVELLPDPIVVGDKVTAINRQNVHEVVAVVGDQAWLKSNSGNQGIYSLKDLHKI